MSNKEVKPISVQQLLLDLQNPRYDVLNNQIEVIAEILDDQGRKLVKLAADIAEAGLNPSELPMVAQHEQDKTKYIVLEGNRRVATAKLLLEPNLALHGKDKSLFQAFAELSREINRLDFENVNCVVLQRQDANRWIKLKHTGENAGVGVVRWDAQQIQRFNERFDKSSPSLQAIQFVLQNGSLDGETKNNLSQVAVTSLERLLSDKYVQQKLGFGFKSGTLQTVKSDKEVGKGLGRIVSDLANKRINVNTIRNREDRKKYVDGFDASSLPTSSSTSPSPASPTAGNSAAAPPTPKKRSNSLSTNRRTLIPPNCILRISPARINAIYWELRSLEVDSFPNAASITLRVFLETSLDHYLTKHTAIGLNSDAKLVTKVQKITEYLEKNNHLDKHALKAIKMAASNPDTLASPNTLNSYVHNKDFSPTANDLKITWDNLQVFIEKIWE